jgi:WS/DGAT/MGAT family acyltransferase
MRPLRGADRTARRLAQPETRLPRYGYERLSAQDNSFLLFESRDVYMHVASTLVFESGPLRTREGGVDIAAIKQGFESVLHQVPRYRQRLQFIPLEGRAVWVDDPQFSLDYHIRHTALPKPGDETQLKKLSSRVMAQQLDRKRPLWETWVVEGLEGGDRFAMISKIHHCMIDGASGIDLAQIQFSPSPEVVPPKPAPRFMPRPAPSAGELARDELTRWLTLPLRALRGFQAFSRETQDVRSELLLRVRALVDTLGMATRASETPLNGTVGPHRAFDWLRVPLAELKAMRKALGCTINDVVLTIVTGAVREYLIYRGVRPESIEFRVGAPVSMRSDEERGRLGNRVSSWVLTLPIAESDPLQQLAAIHAETQRLKKSRQALGVEMIMRVVEYTPSVLLTLGARSISGPINTIVTNVPGPQFPLYFHGAKLLALYPQVPLLESLGLGIALASYNGTVHWGFNADPDIVPDLDAFVARLRGAYDDVARAAGVPVEASAARRMAPVEEPRRARPSNGSPRETATLRGA